MHPLHSQSIVLAQGALQPIKLSLIVMENHIKSLAYMLMVIMVKLNTAYAPLRVPRVEDEGDADVGFWG